jgi:small-conductance mechanosensitive channel
MSISQMHDMSSRPAVDETWFPSSEGDWVLVGGDSPHQVVHQTVDVIKLRDLDSVNGFMPTADYYSAGYPNLSRAKTFRISVVFGIDYATQREDVTKIEKAFSAGIKRSCKGTAFEKHVIDVNADFESAGDSSLNYLMLATFQPEAAGDYNKIKRRIQRACVIVCSENDWSIPFPELSVHLPEGNPKPAE